MPHLPLVWRAAVAARALLDSFTLRLGSVISRSTTDSPFGCIVGPAGVGGLVEYKRAKIERFPIAGARPMGPISLITPVHTRGLNL